MDVESKKHSEIHSVILNLNTNFSNNKGSNFTTIVNKQLELKPNTLVALYKGNIARKPIILPSETTLQIKTKEAEFPSEFMTGTFDLSLNGRALRDDLNAKDSTYPVGSIYPTLNVTLAKGFYSRLEFCRNLCLQVNEQLQTLPDSHNRVIVGFKPTEA